MDSLTKLRILIFIIVISSCSYKEVLKYPPDQFLTNEVALSKFVNISVNLPHEWFIAEDNLNSEIILWLVNNDYSTSINFRQIHLDSTYHKENRLRMVTRSNKLFLKTMNKGNTNAFMNEEEFEINGKEFMAYEYYNDEGNRIRTVIFQNKENFFESNAVTINPDQDYEKLYRLQNSVLSSLK